MKCTGKDESDIMTDSQLNLNFFNNNYYQGNDSVNLIGNDVDNESFNQTFSTLFDSFINFTPTVESLNGTISKNISRCEWNFNGSNEHFNCTKEEYVTYWRGPKRMPLETALSVSKL